MGVASCSSTRNSCDEFFSDSCPLYEDAILSFRHTDTAGQCQDLCRNLEGCEFFTWFETQCYLLNSCDYIEACLCCISGPGLDTSDDVDDCLIGCETSTTTTTPTTAATSTTSISISTTPALTTTNKPSTITT